jgi:hypothetical protein
LTNQLCENNKTNRSRILPFLSEAGSESCRLCVSLPGEGRASGFRTTSGSLLRGGEGDGSGFRTTSCFLLKGGEGVGGEAGGGSGDSDLKFKPVKLLRNAS